MRFTLVMACLIVCLMPTGIGAQELPADLLEELYIKSGMAKQFHMLPQAIQSGFDQAVNADRRLQKLSQQDLAEMRKAILTAYSSERIKEMIFAECRNTLVVNDIKRVLDWLQSPIGKKITAYEEAAATPAAFTEIQKYAKQLQASPPPQERLEMMIQLDTALRATDASVEIAMHTQFAVMLAIMASTPTAEQRPSEQLFEAIEENRPQIETMMRNQTLISFLYIYQNCTEEELKLYIHFGISRSGARYHRAAISGLKKAMLKGGYAWGEAIAEILKASKKKSDA